jgi:AcrR family transcriptional regulator
MDDLASELGMSKKTLYVYFAGKDALIGAILDFTVSDIRAHADAMFNHPTLSFAQKLHGFVTGLVQRLSSLNARSLRDLQRYAPHLHQRIEEQRAKNIPYVFGRFIALGIKEGQVREAVEPGFAIEFFLHAMQGLMQPATIERLRLAPHEVIPQGIDLFFNGLLTPIGRKNYEKVFAQ